MIVKFHSLQKSLTGCVLAFATLLLVGSCGGGGAATDPLQGGTMSFLPAQTAGGVVYAGIPVTLTIAGGRRPYALVSSEPNILAVPLSLNSNQFTVVGNNPGVIDAGLAATDLPRRTVILTARDSIGLQAQVEIQVAQNFLTGYGLSFSSNCPLAGTARPGVCAGGETAVQMAAVFNGALAGNRQFRFEVLRGPVAFVFPGTNNTGNAVNLNSDHTGRVTAIMRVQANVPTQLAVIRVIDVATGVYADTAFVISQASPTTALTAVPNAVIFTGNLSTECGTGVSEFLVFDGQAPYTAISSTADVQVRRLGNSTDQPGRFEVRANNPAVCLDEVPVVITDSAGGRTTFTVSTVRGSVTPTPPPAFAAAPTTVTLVCGSSGSVTVIGGSGQYAVNSSHPRVSAVVSGNTLTITRNTGDGLTTYPLTGVISITDGATVLTVTANVPANCP